MSEATKPRRPPDYPLFAGLVWRQAEAGRMRADDPLAQWAYVCPSHPEGLEASRVRSEPLDVQTEAAWTWFNANFEPLGQGGPLSAWDDPHFAWNVAGRWMGESRLASAILDEEFSGVAAPAVISEVSRTLTETSQFWTLKSLPSPAIETPDVATVRVALAKLKEVAETPPPAGHNQGPPLVDSVPVAEIVEGVRQAEVALAASEVEGKRSPLVTASLKGVEHLLAGAMRQVGQELAKVGMSDGGHWLSVLFRYLVDGVTLLWRWRSGT